MVCLVTYQFSRFPLELLFIFSIVALTMIIQADKKWGKEAAKERTTGPSFGNLLQRRGSRPMKRGVTMEVPHTAPRLPGCCARQ